MNRHERYVWRHRHIYRGRNRMHARPVTCVPWTRVGLGNGLY